MAECKAALNIKGEAFTCDQEAPHAGWAHGNKEAEAIWCSDGEAKAAQRKVKSGHCTCIEMFDHGGGICPLHGKVGS